MRGGRLKNKDSPKYPGYLTYQLYVSPAFRDLTDAQRDILILIYYEIEMVQKKKRGKYVEMLKNRNEIVISYQEIGERLGYSDKTIWLAFKAFLAHGFLQVVKHGGGAKGDYQVYGITEDWRKWKPGMVVRETTKSGRFGWQRKKISIPQGMRY